MNDYVSHTLVYTPQFSRESPRLDMTICKNFEVVASPPMSFVRTYQIRKQ